MPKHRTVPTMTSGQLRDLSAKLTQSINLALPGGTAQSWIGNKEALENLLTDLLNATKPVPAARPAPSIFDYREMVTGRSCCGCHKPLSGELGFHPNSYGWPVQSFPKLQWIYALCPCGHQSPFDKLGIELNLTTGNDPSGFR